MDFPGAKGRGWSRSGMVGLFGCLFGGIALQIMTVVMMMGINAKFVGVGGAEKGHKFRVLTDMFGSAAAAQMAIQADHTIRCPHHHM